LLFSLDFMVWGCQWHPLSLTAINQKRFTIIDYHALESLGVTKAVLMIDFYLAYLAHCRALADENGVGLRDLHRALWQWSNEREKTKGGADCTPRSCAAGYWLPRYCAWTYVPSLVLYARYQPT
jgi:hypothetical protein